MSEVTHDTVPRQVLRFYRAERWMHWSIAVPFMVCYTTALILVVFYNPDPTRPYRDLFSWIHRISGLALMTLPYLSAVTNLRSFRVHLTNIKESWVWTFADIKWLMLMGLAMINKNIKLPEEGKFNAGEKLNFMMVMTTYPIFGLTGVAIWATSGAGLPWLVHFVMAALVTPVMFGHIFMATINPASRKGLSGMITGFVDQEWASHHYRKWFKEEFAPSGRRSGGEAEGAPKRRVWLERLALAFVGLMLPALFAVGGVIAKSETHPQRFLSERQPLRSKAAATAQPVPGSELAIGARVVLVSSDPPWTMVTDAHGRAGYVKTATVVKERPPHRPAESEFPDCDAAEVCEIFARSHFDQCRLDCREIDDPHCAEKCEDRYYECLEECDET